MKTTFIVGGLTFMLITCSLFHTNGYKTGYKLGYKDGSTNAVDYHVHIQMPIPNGSVSTMFVTNLSITGARHIQIER